MTAPCRPILRPGSAASSLERSSPRTSTTSTPICSRPPSSRQRRRLGHRIVQPGSGIASRPITSACRAVATGSSASARASSSTSTRRAGPPQQVLGAVYTAATVPVSSAAVRGDRPPQSHAMARTARSGVRQLPLWCRSTHMPESAHIADPFALRPSTCSVYQAHIPIVPEVLGALSGAASEVHPDHGGSADDAGQRILDLTEARRILLRWAASAPAPLPPVRAAAAPMRHSWR